MISGMSNTVSALTALGKKMGVTANNVANANSDGFKKSRAILQEGAAGGVDVEITRVESPGPLVTEQTTEGHETKELSNVTLEEEIPQALLTEKLFAANTKVLQVEEEMIGSVLDIVG